MRGAFFLFFLVLLLLLAAAPRVAEGYVNLPRDTDCGGLIGGDDPLYVAWLIGHNQDLGTMAPANPTGYFGWIAPQLGASYFW